MKHNEIKEYLNRYLAGKLRLFHSGSKQQQQQQQQQPFTEEINNRKLHFLCSVTCGKNTKTTNSSLLPESHINDFTAEETDQRSVRHVINCIGKGYEESVVRTVDMGVFVLLLSYYPNMKSKLHKYKNYVNYVSA